jgi:glycerol-3-phosphate dehydrogenase (NAD(P)+)
MQQTGYTQVGIIGAGAFGSAIGQALTRAQTQVLYYDKDPSRTTTGSMEDLVKTCEVLILCIPSWEVEEVVKVIHKHAHPSNRSLVIATSKGVVKGFVTMDKLLADHLPKHFAVGILGGAMIAEEISQARPANGVLALSDISYFEPLRTQLAKAKLYMQPSSDTHGVAICAVLKNIYTIALGMSDGLRLGLNAKGWLSVTAMAEMRRLVAELGGDPRIVDTVAGLGDLMSSSFGSDSFNYRIGKSLAEGIVAEHVKSEGLVALSELAHKVKLTDYPLAHVIEQSTFHYGKPQKLVDLFSV